MRERGGLLLCRSSTSAHRRDAFEDEEIDAERRPDNGQFLGSILAFGLQSQRVLSIHGADRIPIEADMGCGGMRIAPNLLQLLFEKDSVTAGRNEQGIDRLDEKPGAEAVVEPV